MRHSCFTVVPLICSRFAGIVCVILPAIQKGRRKIIPNDGKMTHEVCMIRWGDMVVLYGMYYLPT